MKTNRKIVVRQSSGNTELLCLPPDKNVSDAICALWFEPSFWKKQSQVIGQSKGRHTTWFVQPPSDVSSTPWVLRHYYRGGMVSKITHDQFFYLGLKNTRPYKELLLLDWMYRQGLPVPKPIGARIVKGLLLYKADLLMEKLAASDLVALLTKRELSESQWQNIGELVARFHNKGIYHADLNAHNILMDDNDKIWLIDFDRCEVRKSSFQWQNQNIQRLHRSFLKEKQQLSVFNFNDFNWQMLLKGYKNKLNT